MLSGWDRMHRSYGQEYLNPGTVTEQHASSATYLTGVTAGVFVSVWMMFKFFTVQKIIF